MDLLDDDILERSAVVANCRMNRERDLTGGNGYRRNLASTRWNSSTSDSPRIDPVAWLDLCCGSGRALIQAARMVHEAGLGSRIEIVGVDLVGMFLTPEPGLECLRLVEASLRTWQPDGRFDLITCVHGLHYIGDKLGLVARAASWLVEDGLFVANLDLENLKVGAGGGSARKLVAELRRTGVECDRRKRLIRCRGRKELKLPCRYLGADDRAGPNYTGQPAVTSHYEIA